MPISVSSKNLLMERKKGVASLAILPISNLFALATIFIVFVIDFTNCMVPMRCFTVYKGNRKCVFFFFFFVMMVAMVCFVVVVVVVVVVVAVVAQFIVAVLLVYCCCVVVVV